MLDIAPEKKVAKINITVDDDINLILDSIVKVTEAYVMLVIPEGNDLINSPIGLKALRKKTLEKGKRIILVVPKGMSYELATKAGFTSTVNQKAVTADLWQTVESRYQEYSHARVGMPSKTDFNKKSHLPKKEKAKKEKVEYVADRDNIGTPDAPPTIISSKDSHEVQPKDGDQVDKKEKKKSQAKESTEEMKKAIGPNVTGMDFSKFMRNGNAAPLFTKKTKPITVSPKQAEKAAKKEDQSSKLDLDVLPKKVGKSISTLSKKKKKKTTPAAKFFLVAIIGLLVMFVGVFVAYAIYFPGVRINIYAESHSLQISDEVLATSAVSGFDVNRKEIPLKKEKIPKSGIKEFKAKEDGVEGKKATGQITFKDLSTSPVTIPVGTKIVISGKKFTNLTEVVVPAGDGVNTWGASTAQCTATEFGSDYNLAANTVGTVTGFDGTVAETATAFTGGEKRIFKVVGQKEVDEAIKELKEELEIQAISDLELTNLDNGYEFIRKSVTTEVKEGTKIDPNVGEESKDTDEEPIVTIETETTGLYYHSASLEKLAEQLLVESYLREQKIAPKDAINTVVEDMNVTVTEIILGKDDKVTIKFNATGLATYHIDEDKIAAQLAGKQPSELADFLAELPGLAKVSDIIYTPSWFPEFLRYVPKEANRIDVRVDVVEPKVQVTPTPTPSAQ